MGLKGNRAVLDRRSIDRRVAVLETRRAQAEAARPVLAARAWDAARSFDRGLRQPVGQVLVEAVFGPDPGQIRSHVPTKRRELLGINAIEDHHVLDQVQGTIPPEEEGVLPGCLAKAALDEPLFILRAQDRCAPAAVRDWAHRARGAGCDPVKVQEAMDVAEAMEEWQGRTGRRKWPD